MLSRSFSQREKVLLAILVVVILFACYYFAVYEPASTKIAEAEHKVAQLRSDITIEEARASSIQKMKDALESIGYGETAISETPYYDNAQNVVKELNEILADSIDYNLSFKPILFQNELAIREIQMVFNCENYTIARGIIRDLSTGPYRCDIGTLKIDTASSDSSDITKGMVVVTLSITYYEIYRIVDIPA